jgi:hypothetical protein
VAWGSAVVAIAWLAMSILFSWHAAHFGSYNKTYGPLGTAQRTLLDRRLRGSARLFPSDLSPALRRGIFLAAAPPKMIVQFLGFTAVSAAAPGAGVAGSSVIWAL